MVKVIRFIWDKLMIHALRDLILLASVYRMLDKPNLDALHYTFMLYFVPSYYLVLLTFFQLSTWCTTDSGSWDRTQICSAIDCTSWSSSSLSMQAPTNRRTHRPLFHPESTEKLLAKTAARELLPLPGPPYITKGCMVFGLSFGWPWTT